jgi:hypothetical protein
MARALRVLIGFNGPRGCFPAIATIAEAADVKVHRWKDDPIAHRPTMYAGRLA